VRKLLVPSFLAVFTAVPMALAAPDPASSRLRAQRSTSDQTERAAISREARAAHRAATRRAKRKVEPDVVVPAHLQAIAQCESGGDPRAIGGGGMYRGKYQFSYATWAGVGGTGDPAAASEAEQDRRAAMLYERSGPGQWPVCGA